VVDKDDEDYVLMNGYVKQVIFAWKNSVGDVDIPDYSKWSAIMSESPVSAKIMIVITWLNWWLNHYIMLIIILNFLIAIISQSYEQVMTTSEVTKYEQRCQMNIEYYVLKSGLPCFFKPYKLSSKWQLYFK
jgi:hypothetical protein